MATAIPSYKDATNEKLLKMMADLRQVERSTIAEIVIIISEIDRRQLFMEKGYTSLYTYLVEECNYSGGSASRRIQAARLFAKNPSIYHKLKTGALGLTQLADHFVHLNAKGAPELKKLEGLSRNDSRFMFKKRKSARVIFRLSDPIASGEFMRSVPACKTHLKKSKDKWAHVALEYISKLEERNSGLEMAIRRMRSGFLMDDAKQAKGDAVVGA